MLPSDIRRTQRISARWLRALAFRGSSLLVLAAFSVTASAADAPLMSEDARPPTVLEYEIVKSWPHDRAAFTQGLIYRDGFLYESTGLNGRSSLRKVKLETGEVVQRESVASEYFAEGLTDWKDRLIQITWQSQLGFVHDLKTFRREGQFNYSGEGWGITHDARRLIMSDGTSTLRFLDPQSFQQTGALEVTYQGKPLANLNELEFVRGRIFANVWQSNSIVVIDPGSGRVTAQIDLPGLLNAEDRAGGVDVLNGIAYDARKDRLFVTGKLWPKIFELKLKHTNLLDKAH
ncbi:MAG: glutaminyl-peptide cyclotransferase [Dokdonella sp.]|uniref:glutaminyl-peptide cyclotransferase n=2 Tax=Dokdonella sp. TaxID=2291710 RepID=UPI002C172F9F|nr:glutaminyl-peptide cyclotransferase [Xanthomonadales bacterium]HQV72682.1 glutaminyl-peptide cyclotransferase [Dokdonella sp.]MBK7211134.1 glutaminyl-peptide cyclotransferase [Xanthomonadales bacterium]MBL0221688.1 glutaminyl-peptide cyclotransferase [Xanthomonadales bacterium]HQW76505.1 glutaminyl-peptide cyclotransferase [Dokdonella sp.]